VAIERLPTTDGGHRDEARPVGEQLDRLLRSLGAPGSRTVTGMNERWAEVVGDALAAHTRPRKVHAGVLTVVVDDPAWAAEVRWMGEQLATRAREVLNDSSIKRIEVRVEGAHPTG
jgi:predicted nucleic acid-binding Zn ribbon protein